jgi:hypothetical protein
MRLSSWYDLWFDATQFRKGGFMPIANFIAVDSSKVPPGPRNCIEIKATCVQDALEHAASGKLHVRVWIPTFIDTNRSPFEVAVIMKGLPDHDLRDFLDLLKKDKEFILLMEPITGMSGECDLRIHSGIIGQRIFDVTHIAQ